MLQRRETNVYCMNLNKNSFIVLNFVDGVNGCLLSQSYPALWSQYPVRTVSASEHNDIIELSVVAMRLMAIWCVVFGVPRDMIREC